MIFFLVLLFVALAVLYLLITADIPGTYKFFLGAAEMVIVGTILTKKYNLSGENGIILLRSQHGLHLIDKLARHEAFWKFFADVGNVMGYGLLSIAIMKKQFSVKALVTGAILLATLSLLVAPFAFVFLQSVLKDAKIERSYDEISGTAPGGSALVLGLVLILGGLFLMLLVGIIMYGVLVLSALLSTLLHGTTAIQNINPGATFLLPGINLPFFEAIIALLIILVVHEGAHAVLARVGRIPVLSSGIVLFGIIPVGAFVEPDEAKLNKLEKEKQTRVLVAGSTSNLMTSVIFFLIFMAFVLTANSMSLTTGAAAGAVKFIVVVLGLTFSLNFVIGTVNLLPLPFFDGYKVLEVNVPQKKIVDGLMALTLIAFLANFIPHLFR